MARNCLDNELFVAKRGRTAGSIVLNKTINLSRELGLSEKQIKRGGRHYQACVFDMALEQEKMRGNLIDNTTFVDRVKTRDTRRVKFAGQIQAFDNAIADMGFIVGQVLGRLTAASPIGPAKKELEHYINMHFVLINGTEWQPGQEISPGDEIVFINVQPYAKRIEEGWSSQAAGGVYRPTARWAKSTFGSAWHVKYTLRPSNVGGSVRKHKFSRGQTLTARRPAPAKGTTSAYFATSNKGAWKSRGPGSVRTGQSLPHKIVPAVYPVIAMRLKDDDQSGFTGRGGKVPSGINFRRQS